MTATEVNSALANVTCSVADSESNNQIDLSACLSEVQWEGTLLDQPGKCTVQYLDAGLDQRFFEGSNLVVAVGGTKVFDGYVFRRNIGEGDLTKVIAYDRLRYLNNKDTFIFKDVSVDEIFTQICTAQELPFKITTSCSYVPAPMAHDNKSLYSMVIRALDEAIIATGQYIVVRDNVGALEMVDIATLETSILVGDGSLLAGFDFESSIDTSTYNYVKLIQENKESKVREVYVAKDSSTIQKWGRLQYFEKVDEEANAAQIKAKADALLKLYNRRTKTLQVKCLGDISVREGSGVGVSISKLDAEGVAKMQMAYCSKVVHTISKQQHTMTLTLEVA